MKRTKAKDRTIQECMENKRYEKGNVCQVQWKIWRENESVSRKHTQKQYSRSSFTEERMTCKRRACLTLQ
jgi:hypothetical protein